MSDASFETVLADLRSQAPRAPERLRNLVEALPAPQPRHVVRLRPALVVVAGAAVAAALGAAAIGGFSESRHTPGGTAVAFESKHPFMAPHPTNGSSVQPLPGSTEFAPSLTTTSRLQRHIVSMTLRVNDLSRSTQTVIRTTRRLGGYVVAADYATGANGGYSSLAVRIPVGNLQAAIARFTQLGSIVSQHLSTFDLQSGLERLDARIAAKRKLIGTLSGESLKKEARELRRLVRRRASLVFAGSYASVSVLLTAPRPAAKQVAPSRFDRFWDNASSILGKEAIAVLYALVVAGPFLLLGALLFFAERARRRRADHRLLEETG